MLKHLRRFTCPTIRYLNSGQKLNNYVFSITKTSVLINTANIVMPTVQKVFCMYFRQKDKAGLCLLLTFIFPLPFLSIKKLPVMPELDLLIVLIFHLFYGGNTTYTDHSM